MPPSARPDTRLTEIFRQLASAGDDAPTIAQKLGLVRMIRTHSQESSQRLDEFLLEEMARLRKGLLEARQRQEELQQVFEKLSAPPWHAATFLRPMETDGGQAAMVMHGGSRRVVRVAEQVEPASLAPGDEVLLGPELNVVVGTSPHAVFRSGETAVFERRTSDGRIVLRSRDEEVLVEAADALRSTTLTAGDLVRWDRNLWMAFERIERSSGTHLFLEETPAETFAVIGGLERQIEQLKHVIRLYHEHAATARKYRLRRRASVLLVGPPGTGKTLVGRALANWVGQLAGSGRSRFMNIKPASLHSVWYSQSEANYREAFRVAREAGEQEPEVPVVMFFDEVDAIGAARGHSLGAVDDRVLTAFMTELDGLEARGNIVVVAATNRRDTLDPALLRPGRLGDLILEVPRPNGRAAREIFARHLHQEIPYASGNTQAENVGARQELIAAAVSRIYSPNGEGALATLTFRDGKRRDVGARDVVSGAVIAKICQGAVERACLREVQFGDSGVRLDDLLHVIDEEFDRAARGLTPANCHRYLEGLPQDVDVVRVDPVERRVRRAYRYLNVA